MATPYFRTRRLISLCFLTGHNRRLFLQRTCRSFSYGRGSMQLKLIRRAESKWAWSVLIGAMAGVTYLYNKRVEENQSTLLPKLLAASEEEKKVKLSSREKRYRTFSSVVYKGDHYLTPGDFVESMLEDCPPCSGSGIQYLDDNTLHQLIRKTPSLSKSSSHFLRNIWDNGIFTYADYVFLITALQKPRKQFEIVFRMIDVDGSDSIDLKEFEEMQRTVSRGRVLDASSKIAQSTLIAHLFGTSGKKKISSHDLFKFIDNLQIEIREIEFQKHSLDGNTITPDLFAKILLSHTNYDRDEVIQRLSREPPLCIKGITFKQFNDFCDLLNALDDFSVAMTMYTIAGMDLSEDEFARAAHASLGKTLDKDVVKTVFRIFDKDGDGKLSQKEFLHVMKNWKIRGMKMKQSKKEGGWSEFKACVVMEMKNQ